MRQILCVGLMLMAVAGCDDKKKTEEGSANAASSAAAAASGAAANASAAATQATAAASAATAAAASVPAGDPGAAVDPTVVPDHDQHEAKAQADIHKGNYKKEMDSLEKDLR